MRARSFSVCLGNLCLTLEIGSSSAQTKGGGAGKGMIPGAAVAPNVPPFIANLETPADIVNRSLALKNRCTESLNKGDLQLAKTEAMLMTAAIDQLPESIVGAGLT